MNGPGRGACPGRKSGRFECCEARSEYLGPIRRQDHPVFRLIKWLLYLAILAFIALVGYAYLGPFFGADFTPAASEIRLDIMLDAD
jgi:hypothetical protein